VLGHLQVSTDEKKQNLARIVTWLCLLFIAFISLCGLTHALEVLVHINADNATSDAFWVAQRVILAFCAAISIATALVGYRFFPVVIDLLSKFELNGEGNLQHIENYLHEVVELVKESVLLLSEQMIVLRSNEASKTLFGSPMLLGARLTDFIHPDDLKIFQNTVTRTMAGYSNTPTTLEYRIVKQSLPPPVVTNARSSPKNVFGQESGRSSPASRFSRSLSVSGTTKIYADSGEKDAKGAPGTPSSFATSSVRQGSVLTLGASASERSSEPVEYVWVESAMCKGMRLTAAGDFEYDVKMVTRNIDERKKQAHAQYETIMRASEEQAHINAAKLRYISCIAHDLKTPLQSFCFSLDLLQRTALQAEQRELAQQATIAVDLMKLTISQTMDISKALSGGKIVPHCATVILSSVISRVKVIM
jgi:PAS domain-containing protein